MKEFTEDEKIIAKYINKKYKWMAKDKLGNLFVFSQKPHKSSSGIWVCESMKWDDMFVLNEVFKSIAWEDAEPTLIKDIYDPQILDDAERKYLTAALKPFHQHIRYVKKVKHYGGGEYIKTAMGHDDGMLFPDFKAGEMYIGMELNKEYSLADLGITYD